MLGTGIPWLFANLALASFIKFKDSQATAIAVTVVLGVGCLYFFLSHGRWLHYVSGFSQSDMQSHLKVRPGHISCQASGTDLQPDSLRCYFYRVHTHRICLRLADPVGALADGAASRPQRESASPLC